MPTLDEILAGLPEGERVASAFLCLSLEAAFPLWVVRLQVQTWRYRQERAAELADAVVMMDTLTCRGAKRGQTAAAFNALAEAVALCAFAPGGVRNFLGRTWQAGECNGLGPAGWRVEVWRREATRDDRT